jgi:hypothetical protein
VTVKKCQNIIVQFLNVLTKTSLGTTFRTFYLENYTLKDKEFLISYRICGIHFALNFTSSGRLSHSAYPEQPVFEGK